MGEFVIAIALVGILNLGIMSVPVVASCTIAPSEGNLTIQGDIRCNVIVSGEFGLSIIGKIAPLGTSIPDKNKQDYVYY